MGTMTRRGLIAVVMGAGLAGPAVAQPSPYEPVPPMRPERMPPPPLGRRMVWEPGHWHWNGIRYVWIGGHYIEPGRYAHYVHGHWANRRGVWEWIPAHWE